MSIEIRAGYNAFAQAVDLYIIDIANDHKGTRSLVTNMVLTELNCGGTREPSCSLKSDKAQFLMDQLWMCGFRPTEGTGSAGALSATTKHLEDMRAFAFNKAGIAKP